MTETAISSIKSAIDALKIFVETQVSGNSNVETLLLAANVVEALADAKSKLIGVQVRLAEKDDKIRELEATLKLHAELVWQEPVYYRKTEAGLDGPFCPSCHDNSEKLVRLFSGEPGYWRCVTCKNAFYQQNTQHSENARFRSLSAAAGMHRSVA